MLSTSGDFGEGFEIKQYEIKDSVTINKEMEKMINNAVDLTCLPRGDAILVLRYFKWNVSKMNDVYYDDPERYLQLAGTCFPESEKPDELECEICMDVTTEPIALSCGHYFCKACWKEHLEKRFEKGMILDCPCMQSGCKHIINIDVVKIISSYLYDRYWFFLKKNYVESQKNVFCPNSSCGRAIIILTSDRKSDNITCTCKQRFCFKCLGEYHSPATCESLTDWDKLSSQDDYLLLTVKHCIHCGCPCERTHGCNHMTCPRCRGEWCWMCRGDWKTHGSQTGGYFQCNIYNAGKSKGNELDKKAESRKAFHEKYQHYSDRWMDHNSLLRQTRERKETVEPQIRAINKTTPRVAERLLDAFDVVITARSWLKNSYIYAYYQTKQSDLFNHQQAQIQHFTEILAGLLFKPIDTYNVEDISAKASGLRMIIDNFAKLC